MCEFMVMERAENRLLSCLCQCNFVESGLFTGGPSTENIFCWKNIVTISQSAFSTKVLPSPQVAPHQSPTGWSVRLKRNLLLGLHMNSVAILKESLTFHGGYTNCWMFLQACTTMDRIGTCLNYQGSVPHPWTGWLLQEELFHGHGLGRLNSQWLLG